MVVAKDSSRIAIQDDKPLKVGGGHLGWLTLHITRAPAAHSILTEMLGVLACKTGSLKYHIIRFQSEKVQDGCKI